MTLAEALSSVIAKCDLDRAQALKLLGEDGVLKAAKLLEGNTARVEFVEKLGHLGLVRLVDADGDIAKAQKVMEDKVEVVTIYGEPFLPTSRMGGWHGTGDISPEVAFNFGLPDDKGSDVDLVAHVLENNGEAALRGTTPQPFTPDGKQGAGQWAGDGGWAYEIRDVPTWDVNQLFEGRLKGPDGSYVDNPLRGELESSIPRRVPPEYIKGAWKIIERHGSLRLGDWIPNPKYKGAS